MKTFRDKVAVVTGGASGVGLAIGKKLSLEGAKVMLADIEQEALDNSRDKLQSDGIEVAIKKTDVTDIDSLKELASETKNYLVRLTFYLITRE